MKIKVNNYVFNPANKTIVFSDYDSIKLDNVILIVEVTTGTIIYNFAAANLTGAVSGNILTLNYDTTSIINTTNLAIYYDDNATNAATDESLALLRRLIQLLTPIGTQDVAQRQRVVVESAPTTAVTVSSGTVTTVTTVGTVNTMNALAGVDARFPIIDQARNTFANAIRQNLTY
jgi:hypothetical protein